MSSLYLLKDPIGEKEHCYDVCDFFKFIESHSCVKMPIVDLTEDLSSFRLPRFLKSGNRFMEHHETIVEQWGEYEENVGMVFWTVLGWPNVRHGTGLTAYYRPEISAIMGNFIITSLDWDDGTVSIKKQGRTNLCKAQGFLNWEEK